MPTLKVNVVDDDIPVSGKKVAVFVFRNLMLDTLLEAATDDKGGAEFEVEENCTAGAAGRGYYVGACCVRSSYSVTALMKRCPKCNRAESAVWRCATSAGGGQRRSRTGAGVPQVISLPIKAAGARAG